MKHIKSIRESSSPGLSKKDIEIIHDAIENEGFGYAFKDYSTFDEIKDEKFHELRRAFIKSYSNLAKYVKSDD